MTEENKDVQPGTGTEDKVSRVDYDNAIERARKFEGQLVDLQKQFEPFKGVDLTALTAKASQFDELSKAPKGNDKKDIDRLIADAEAAKEAAVRGQFDPVINEYKTKLSEKENRLRELEVVEKVFTSHAGKFVDTATEDFKDIIRRTFDQDETGALFVKDEKGQARFSDIDGRRHERMGPDEFIAELEKKKPHLFKAKGSPGAMQNGQPFKANGASPSNGGVDYQTFAALPQAQKAEAVSKMDAQQQGQLAVQAFSKYLVR
jgi:hypothetical protein